MIKVRKMTIDDLDRVYEIETQSFQTPWSRDSIEKEIVENTIAAYFVVTVFDDVVGYGGAWLIMDEMHITNVAIAPECRGKGYSIYLIKSLIGFGQERGFKHMTLEVRVSNHVAISLYEKTGFVAVGKRPKYYVDSGEDALVMWKEL